jgi:preprotein translocase subunit SecF
MFIIKHSNMFLALSALTLVSSLIALGAWGLNSGIEFTGGTSVQVSFTGATPTQEQVISKVGAETKDALVVRKIGDTAYDIRTGSLVGSNTTEFEKSVTTAIMTWNAFQGKIDSVTQIGPSIGHELKRKSAWAIFFVLIAIVLYIAYVFRGVSKPVSSWMYGIVTVVVLLHDVLIPMGVFAALSHFIGSQADTLFVTALLAILGFSVSNTIVVLDRVRENLQGKNTKHSHEHFSTLVGDSVSQTWVRSANTSITVILALCALYFVGPTLTHDFSLTLIVGVLAGLFSSLCVAPPLLVLIAKHYAK